jgi:hypothetical protein
MPSISACGNGLPAVSGIKSAATKETRTSRTGARTPMIAAKNL